MVQDRGLTTNDELPPIDEEELADLIASIGVEDTAAQIEIFDLFFETAPPLMERVSDGARQANWEKVRSDLHALKGSCELFGADRLAELCRRLERSIAADEIADGSNQVAEIQAEFNRVVDYLRGKHPAAFYPSESDGSEPRTGNRPTTGLASEEK